MRVPAFIHLPIPAVETPASSFAVGLFGRLIEATRAYFAEQAAADEIDGLDDRMLADIGLSRYELPRRSTAPRPFMQ